MLTTIIGRGHSGTRAMLHTLSASGVWMGEPLNVSGDLLPPEAMYEASRLIARHVRWLGGLEWDFSRLHTMPIPPEFEAPHRLGLHGNPGQLDSQAGLQPGERLILALHEVLEPHLDPVPGPRRGADQIVLVLPRYGPTQARVVGGRTGNVPIAEVVRDVTADDAVARVADPEDMPDIRTIQGKVRVVSGSFHPWCSAGLVNTLCR